MGARARPTGRCRNNITDGERDFPVADRFWLALLSPPGTTALTRAATDGRAMSGSDDEMRDAEVKADAKPKATGQPMDADSDSDDGDRRPKRLDGESQPSPQRQRSPPRERSPRRDEPKKEKVRNTPSRLIRIDRTIIAAMDRSRDVARAHLRPRAILKKCLVTAL